MFIYMRNVFFDICNIVYAFVIIWICLILAQEGPKHVADNL